jgi:hypothetical protein
MVMAHKSSTSLRLYTTVFTPEHSNHKQCNSCHLCKRSHHSTAREGGGEGISPQEIKEVAIPIAAAAHMTISTSK